MRRATLTVASVAALTFTGTADAHYTPSCQKDRCKHHVIAPYEMGFLRTVGHCEARQGFPYGSRHGELQTGLRVTDPSGKFRGRFQFDLTSWRGAGGSGDPVNAGWIEQSYRAVVWLHRNGRQSWPSC